MADSAVLERFVVQSHAGPYEVLFDDEGLVRLNRDASAATHVIVDARVAELYAADLDRLLAGPNVLRVSATEASKSLDRLPHYVEALVQQSVRQGHVLVAVGGGVVQDIVCFLAATLLRGLEWRFYPTTLLAQADSCIGSKSSINSGAIKNILGTFTPPSSVVICTPVLGTLDEVDLRSGIGEMLKVHAIDGPESFDRIAADYPRLLRERELLRRYIRASLEIKRVIIEQDEFDRGPRNVMNYGHSFGHAIESATDFEVPHGIAVTIGMDLANYVAVRLGRCDEELYVRMHPTLAANYAGFEDFPIPVDRLLAALASDKKNRGAELRLVLPDRIARIALVNMPNDSELAGICADYLARERTAEVGA
jgi:3-dehydroquinate synthase